MVFWGRTPAALVAALVCVTVVTVGGRVRPTAIGFTTRTLPNGLRLVIHEDHSTPVASVQVWYHAGSKYEPAGASGVAHLLERLMAKGSKNVEPNQHATLIAQAGGQSSAYTTHDATVFWNTVPSTHVPLALWLEADRMATLRLDRDVIEFERDILKEERGTLADQQPFGRLSEVVYSHAFNVHPYKRPPLGLATDLATMQADKVRDFYRTWYVPDRTTVVVAGDVDPALVVTLVQEYFGRIPARAPTTEPQRASEPRRTQPGRVTTDEPWPLPVVVLAHRVPADGHPDSYALRVATTILSNGQSSRLYRSLTYEHAFAVSVQAGAYFAEDPGLFYASAIVQPGNTPAEVEAAVETELDLLRTAQVPDAELARAKNQLARDAALGRVTVAQKAELLGRGATLHGDPGFANTAAERLDAVTAADIQRVAQTYFAPTTRLTITIKARPASTEPPKRGGR
jgi:zinc protease